MKDFKIITTILITLLLISCNEFGSDQTSTVISQEIKTTDPETFIKSIHSNHLHFAEQFPNEYTNYLRLKYRDDYVNTVNVNKEISLDGLMENEELKAKVILYSFSLGLNVYKEDIVLLLDEEGFLKEKDQYISKYSDLPKIKKIAELIDNWTDGNSIYDYTKLKE